jgi:hypothetical protein
VVDGLDLVGQEIDLGDADGQVGIELVGQADAVGLDEEELEDPFVPCSTNPD